MERAGEFLGRVVRRLERPEAAIAWLAGAWPAIVGHALAAHTRPVECQGGCLQVTADARAWRAQLEPMAREFCGRINQAWGGHLVREVRFVAAKPGPQRIPREFDNEHTPFVRRRKA
jgi:predicted nucleic acid-binding Zn ribbon protein